MQSILAAFILRMSLNYWKKQLGDLQGLAGTSNFLSPTISSFLSLKAPIASSAFHLSCLLHPPANPTLSVFSFPSPPTPHPSSFYRGKLMAQLYSAGCQAGPSCTVEDSQELVAGTLFSHITHSTRYFLSLRVLSSEMAYLGLIISLIEVLQGKMAAFLVPETSHQAQRQTCWSLCVTHTSRAALLTVLVNTHTLEIWAFSAVVAFAGKRGKCHPQRWRWRKSGLLIHSASVSGQDPPIATLRMAMVMEASGRDPVPMGTWTWSRLLKWWGLSEPYMLHASYLLRYWARRGDLAGPLSCSSETPLVPSDKHAKQVCSPPPHKQSKQNTGSHGKSGTWSYESTEE